MESNREERTMWATEAEAQEQFRAATFSTYDFRVTDIFDNGEFLTSATLELLERGVVVERREFVGSTEFEESYREGSAAVQAAAYAWAWIESRETPLEERLAPFGPEWQLEQEERRNG